MNAAALSAAPLDLAAPTEPPPSGDVAHTDGSAFADLVAMLSAPSQPAADQATDLTSVAAALTGGDAEDGESDDTEPGTGDAIAPTAAAVAALITATPVAAAPPDAPAPVEPSAAAAADAPTAVGSPTTNPADAGPTTNWQSNVAATRHDRPPEATSTPEAPPAGEPHATDPAAGTSPAAAPAPEPADEQANWQSNVAHVRHERPPEAVGAAGAAGDSSQVPPAVGLTAPARSTFVTETNAPATAQPPVTDAQRAEMQQTAANAAALGATVRTMKRGDHRIATMDLTPAELGAVRVEIRTVDGKVSVHLAAATSDGAEALRNALAPLRRELEAAGVGLDHVEVDVAGHRGDSPTSQERSDPLDRLPHSDRPSRPATSASPQNAVLPRPRPALAGLDVQL